MKELFPIPAIHPSFQCKDGDRVDADYCIKSIHAFAADNNLDQVFAWGLFAARRLRESEIDVAYLQEKRMSGLP